MDALTSVAIPDKLLPLSSLPSLRSVYVTSPSRNDLKSIQSISWLRSCAALSEFALNELHLLIRPGEKNDYEIDRTHWQDVLPFAPHVRYEYDYVLSTPQPNCNVIVDEALSDSFSLSSSVRYISVDAIQTVFTFSVAIKHIPKSVEELDITFPTCTLNLSERSAMSSSYVLEQWDTRAAEALRPEASPNLRNFRAHLGSRTVRCRKAVVMTADGQLYRTGTTEDGADDRDGPEEHDRRIPLLPLCQQICDERGIRFSIDARHVQAPEQNF